MMGNKFGGESVEKYFNHLSIAASIVGGICVSFLGGMDQLLDVLLFLMIVDFVTGWLKAIATKSLSSKIGMLGIAKKVMILFVVAVSVKVESIVGNNIPIREMVIIFYIANEGISFCENVLEFIPLPEKLKDYFIQLRNKDKN